MTDPNFSAFIDCLFGPGSDPWTLTGGRDNSRCVRLRNYAECPHLLGEYWVPADYGQHVQWLPQVEEQPTVAIEQMAAYCAAGQPAIARSAALCTPNNRIFVLEHDSLIVPTSDECRALGTLTAEELKSLQPTVVYQAAMATGMPHSAMVHSGGKSLHIYLVAADPENWPQRPPSLGDSRGLPEPLVQELRDRTRAKSKAEREGVYNRWYAWQYLLYLATGKFDQQVFQAAGQGGYVRTPGAVRGGNGPVQRLVSVQRPITWQEHWEWLLAQVSPEVRQWALEKASGGAKPIKQTPELREMLRLEVPGGWKDMVVRQVQQGGQYADEQALTKQVLGVVAELYATQRQPEIVRRPHLEKGDWGDIQASFLWWVSFLTMNHLSIPWTSIHPQAPTPVGWVFTGLDWWWEDGNGRSHNLREVWKPGNEGDWLHRQQLAQENALYNHFLEHMAENQAARDRWAADNWHPRSAPTSVATGEKIKLGVKASEAAKAHIRETNTAAMQDRYRLFFEQLGGVVKRTTERCAMFPSSWMRFDGKIWRQVPVEVLQQIATTAILEYPRLDAKGVAMDWSSKEVEETIKFAFMQELHKTLEVSEDWKQREGAVVFNNGTLYLDSRTGHYEFREGFFDPEDMAIHLMPHDYNPAVPTPLFDGYMQTSFPQEHERECILQFMGYVLDPQAAQKPFCWWWANPIVVKPHCRNSSPPSRVGKSMWSRQIWIASTVITIGPVSSPRRVSLALTKKPK